jgi:hypothetical protein
MFDQIWPQRKMCICIFKLFCAWWLTFVSVNIWCFLRPAGVQSNLTSKKNVYLHFHALLWLVAFCFSKDGYFFRPTDVQSNLTLEKNVYLHFQALLCLLCMYVVGWKCQSTSQFLVEEVHGHDHMKEALALLVTFDFSKDWVLLINCLLRWGGPWPLSHRRSFGVNTDHLFQ